MDSIIKRISDIEHTAVSIIEHSKQEKKLLKNEMLEKQQNLEKEIELDTASKLEAINTNLEQTKRTSLSQLQSETEATLQALEKDFEQNHTRYAAEILTRITEA